MMDKNKAIKFLKLANNMADLFSKDGQTKVGAIALEPNSFQIKSSGYNGFPRNLEESSCRWQKPNKYNYVVHAEANMICNASLNGVSLLNTIAVTTLYPCKECAKLMIQSGIKTIITKTPDYSNEIWGESFKISKEMFEELGVDVVLINEDEL